MSVKKEKSIEIAASKCGISEKTARKYLKTGKLPGELKKAHDWRTRKDPFEEVWLEILGWLQDDPDVIAKELFSRLQEKYPGNFANGQLRTLQRRVKEWRQMMAKKLIYASLDGTTETPEIKVVGVGGRTR